MMGLRHPFTGALYEKAEDGTVLVTNKDGRCGRFTASARWLSGELQECDPQLCGWVGGPQIVNHRLAKARQLHPEDYVH